MAVRLFDGVDDRILLAGGSIGSVGRDPYTILMLLKPLAINFFYPIALRNSVNGSIAAIQLGSTSQIFAVDQFSIASTTALAFNNTDWQLIAIRRAASPTVPRFSRSILGSSWAHADGNASTNGPTGICDIVEVGSAQGGNYQNMRLAVSAVWNRRLSDAEIESITNATTQIAAVSGGAPDAIWQFNQTAVTDAIVDLMGNNANETARTGTTVVTTDDPTWTFTTPPAPSAKHLAMYL